GHGIHVVAANPCVSTCARTPCAFERGSSMASQGSRVRHDRREFLKAGVAGAAAMALHAPSFAASAAYAPRPRPADYRVRVQATTLDPSGRNPTPGIAVDGRYPGPESRVRAGSMFRAAVENGLTDSPTTIHWHGLLVPAGMDGVPDVANYPI